MKNYSANLYRKFKTRALKTLAGDEFYEYFMNIVESGVRFYGQKNEALIKIIDEEWVSAIEQCIIPMENIIKRPRKFIRREESVVPIELARKTGADAVKHLATHTQFIRDVKKNGDIIPSKILNVYNEESFDIYENRFIITLLQRVNQFLDKRYSALFQTTGDEFASVLKIDNSFNDNDEKVEYELVMKLHQGQGYLDTKNNDPLVYQRIEQIRARVNGFMKTEFYQTLAGCAKVKTPINKTNLISKEPNFRKCYELWQFMDQYNDLGYSIEVKEYEVAFDEQYIDELNTLVLFNYLVIKNNLEQEHNKPIDVINFKKKRVLKPKFIKNIIEEFVFDFDMQETELRKIFNEEITKSYAKKGGDEDEIVSAIERAVNFEMDKKSKEKEKEMQMKENREQAIKDAQAAKELKEKQKLLEKEKKDKLIEKQKQQKLLAKEKKDKLIEKQKQQKLLEKEKIQKLMAKEKEKRKALLEKEKQAKQLEKSKAQELLMKEKEKEKQAKKQLEKSKAKELLMKEKEKEKQQKMIEKQKDKEPLMKEK